MKHKKWHWGEENRSRSVSAKLTEATYIRIKQLAQKSNVSVSEYLRNILEKKYKTNKTKVTNIDSKQQKTEDTDV